MSKYHPLSNYYVENKEDIPLTTSKENQPLSPTLTCIMAPPVNSSPLKGPKAPKGYKTAKPTKTLSYAEKSMHINDDYLNQSNTDQTKDLVGSSSDLETTDWKTKGKGKGKGKGRRRAKGKEKGKAMEADHTQREQNIDAAKPSLILATRKKPINSKPINLQSFILQPKKTAHETSEHRKKLPSEIWIKIWELVASDNPRNLDIWTWSEGPEKLWENEKQRITHGPQNRSTGLRWNPFKFITTQIVPPILHISCLSREIGLKYYKLGFGCNLGMSKIPSEDYSILEPRIYYRKNDLVCPMGRFTHIEAESFWNNLPEEISAIALNLGKLNNVAPKLREDYEDYDKQIAHEHFSYEYSRGLIQDPDRLEELESFSLREHRGKRFSKRATKIYLYCFTDYISKRGPRDFRFTPLVDDSKGLGLRRNADSDSSFENLLRYARLSHRVDDFGRDDKYKKWGRWLRYGGLTWLKDGGPKPGWIEIDNPTAYDRARNNFFWDLEPWAEKEFKKRGVPNIGMNSQFWVPGVPEVHSTKLEIHG
ncbi:uncharacterized protein EAF01_010796 [Botrytis porri]|uniref:uncharacterized protein n=1 Tax=Botrytis porri TaxID=87229 RepID=UPI0019010EB1|nr:uncharacterized protein EAF01_010796 [Botrytis porri]KAF7889303.1 hypothetical protein EAF01_010796 [Botrytis porri]